MEYSHAKGLCSNCGKISKNNEITKCCKDVTISEFDYMAREEKNCDKCFGCK